VCVCVCVCVCAHVLGKLVDSVQDAAEAQGVCNYVLV